MVVDEAVVQAGVSRHAVDVDVVVADVAGVLKSTGTCATVKQTNI